MGHFMVIRPGQEVLYSSFLPKVITIKGGYKYVWRWLMQWVLHTNTAVSWKGNRWWWILSFYESCEVFKICMNFLCDEFKISLLKMLGHETLTNICNTLYNQSQSSLPILFGRKLSHIGMGSPAQLFFNHWLVFLLFLENRISCITSLYLFLILPLPLLP